MAIAANAPCYCLGPRILWGVRDIETHEAKHRNKRVCNTGDLLVWIPTCSRVAWIYAAIFHQDIQNRSSIVRRGAGISHNDFQNICPRIYAKKTLRINQASEI